MDSQSVMLEIASSSGSSDSSSDSIVNISRSGASSLSTSHSITTTTTTTREDLVSEIDTLREDKKNLEARIRGYRALSNLLVECRKENQQLKSKVKVLSAQSTKSKMSDAANQSAASSPFSLVSLQASQQNLTSEGLPHPDVSRLSLQDQKLSPLDLTSTHTTSTMDQPVSNPPVTGSPSSLQETVGPPGDSGETKLVSLPALNGAGIKPGSAGLKDVPKQESLGPVHRTHSPATRDAPSPSNNAGLRGALTTEHSSPELLQLDSDKYDEATYEKVGLQLGMGHAGLTSSMYGAGGNRTESRPSNFPSLSSEVSNGLAHLPSHGSQNSIYNPPYMAMMHHSQMGQSYGGAQNDLASAVENITERLNSEPGDSMPAIALQMHQIAERISKVERKERDQKALVSTLMRDNHTLKQAVKMAENAHQTEVVALREQNTRLMQQLKGQHRDEHTTTLQSAASPGDWVHVERPTRQDNLSSGSDQSLVDRVRKLEQEKAELLRANGNWKGQWDKMEQNNQIKLSELSHKLASSEQELSAHKSRLAEQTAEFEARMLEMKRRIGEEENLKEEAMHQQHLAERRCVDLQDQLTGMQGHLADITREKHTLSVELSVLKARTSGHSSGAPAASSSPKVLEAEIAMLKEQLKVFAEDFEHEREDRNMAQTARDAAKKEAETMARQLHSLSSQVKHLQRQIKDRDDTISVTLRQTDTLQRQAADYKKKLAAEWEEKQTLRRLLTQTQQQQQQHMRNPYRTEDLSSMHNPAPMYPAVPPTQSPSRTAPYYGVQGSAAQPMNRNTVGVVPPEHLPGAWTCSACTYINYPGRTVCETCGMINVPRSHPENFGYPSHDMYGSSEHALLMSRGGEQNQGGNMPMGGDLVADSGAEHWAPTPH